MQKKNIYYVLGLSGTGKSTVSLFLSFLLDSAPVLDMSDLVKLKYKDPYSTPLRDNSLKELLWSTIRDFSNLDVIVAGIREEFLFRHMEDEVNSSFCILQCSDTHIRESRYCSANKSIADFSKASIREDQMQVKQMLSSLMDNPSYSIKAVFDTSVISARNIAFSFYRYAKGSE